MGKAQYKKKTAPKRHNPIRVPDSHLGSGRAEGQANPNKERQMLPILEKLNSPEYADRTWACAAICNLIQNDAATRRLFQGRNVVGALIERLSDSVDEVVVEASGALRNLAIDGGHELCSEMFNKGIMPNLVVLMGKISTTIDAVIAGPAKELSDEELQRRKHLLNLSENVVALIWSLAEASHKTLDAVNAAGTDGLLIKVLQGRKQLGVGLPLAAAQALFSLTQDNYTFVRALLANPDALPVLIEVAREDHSPLEQDLKGKNKASEVDQEIGDGRALLTRVLVTGVLRNVVLPGARADASVGIVKLTNEVILPLVNSLLDVNLVNVAQRVGELVQQIPKDVPVTAKDMSPEHRSPQERTLERMERMLMTVVTALEILTGICAGLEDAEEPVAEEVVEDDQEDQDMEDALADEDLIAMGREPNAPTQAAMAPIVKTAVTLQYLLGTLSLPTRLASLAQLTPLSLPPTGSEPSMHSPTTAALSQLHLRALEALNNLLLSTAATAEGGDLSLSPLLPPSTWDAMFAVISSAGADAVAATLKARGQEMRLEIIQAALGCAWGFAKSTVPPATPSQEEMLTTLLPHLQPAAAARTIDTLATLASRPGVPVDETRVISTWLMEQLVSSKDTELTVALVNAIIDIFADEGRDYDVIFVQGGFVTALAGIVARFRSEARKVDRRKTPELRGRAEEAYENLVAFIKYRRSL